MDLKIDLSNLLYYEGIMSVKFSAFMPFRCGSVRDTKVKNFAQLTNCPVFNYQWKIILSFSSQIQNRI